MKNQAICIKSLAPSITIQNRENASDTFNVGVPEAYLEII